MRCRFYCCWCCYYTTAKANAAKIFAVGVGVALPFLLLLVAPLPYREVKCCPNFRRVGFMLPISLLLVPPLHYREVKCCPNFRRVGVMLPTSLLLVPPLHYRGVKCCSNFRRWCGRCDAVFTAVGAAITLRRGQMLLKFSPLV